MKLADKRTDKFVMPVFSFNVINDESHAINRFACLEFISVPTGAGCLAEAMVTVTEVYHTLKFGHQEDARRDARNVADMTGYPPSAPHGFSRVGSVSCRLANEVSTREREVSFDHHDAQECQTQLCAESCRDGKCATP